MAASNWVSSTASPPVVPRSKLVFREDVSEASVQAEVGLKLSELPEVFSDSNEAALFDLDMLDKLLKNASSLSKCLGIMSSVSTMSSSESSLSESLTLVGVFVSALSVTASIVNRGMAFRSPRRSASSKTGFIITQGSQT